MKKILLALFLLVPHLALVSAKAKADVQQTDEVTQLDQADQFRNPPRGRCDGSPIYSGMGLFTAAGLPGWCDAYPNAGYPGACRDYYCCARVAAVWCQNVLGCSTGSVNGGGPGAPGYIHCY